MEEQLTEMLNEMTKRYFAILDEVHRVKDNEAHALRRLAEAQEELKAMKQQVDLMDNIMQVQR